MPGITGKILVKLTVLGLPTNFQEKIDADKVNDPDKLMRELVKFKGYSPSPPPDPRQDQQFKRVK